MQAYRVEVTEKLGLDKPYHQKGKKNSKIRQQWHSLQTCCFTQNGILSGSG